jgi:hypothetical protein
MHFCCPLTTTHSSQTVFTYILETSTHTHTQRTMPHNTTPDTRQITRHTQATVLNKSRWASSPPKEGKTGKGTRKKDNLLPLCVRRHQPRIRLAYHCRKSIRWSPRRSFHSRRRHTLPTPRHRPPPATPPSAAADRRCVHATPLIGIPAVVCGVWTDGHGWEDLERCPGAEKEGTWWIVPSAFLPHTKALEWLHFPLAEKEGNEGGQRGVHLSDGIKLMAIIRPWRWLESYTD